jgi:predicted N-acetyltransferase YhbS
MIQILPASPAHAEAIARLNQSVHQLHLDRAPHFFRQPGDAERLEAFRELLTQANTRAFIAYADDEAIGYVLATIREQADNVYSPARRWLYVDQISVEPRWKRQGLGRQLMQVLLNEARAAGITELETDTWAFNNAAQAFFQACGFQPKILRHWLEVGS